MIKKNRNLMAVVLLFASLLIGCSSTPKQPAASVPTIELNVSAAISVKDALGEIQQHYQAKKPNIKISYNFGASGSLQKQIEQGAPADLFISAATKQVDDLDAKNLIHKNTRKNLLENQLVMIAPKSSTLGLIQFDDVTKAGVQKFAMGEPEVVPAGQYTLQVLKKMDIWDTVKSKAVLAKDVRTVLTYVETGNVEAGFVYKTDTVSSDKVRIIGSAPAASHQPIIYPAAVLSSAKQPKEAEDFLAFLSSPEAKSVFEKYGFTLAK